MVNFGSSLSERRYLRTVFLDSPVRRDISLIEKWSRKCQRRMTLNNSMSITPSPPGHAKRVKFEHGSVLGGKTRAARVSSQWKSTAQYSLHQRSSRKAAIQSPRTLLGGLDVRFGSYGNQKL